MTPHRAATITLAEDNALLRAGLVEVLEGFAFTVLAAVPDAAALLDAVDQVRPDLVLTDVRMPPDFRDEGLQAALQIRRRFPRQPVMVLSQYVEHTHAAELLATDDQGIGYLLKDRVSNVRVLVTALHEVMDGGTVIDPEVVRRLLAHRRDPLSRLTDREKEVLALMAQGRSNSAIAADLVITEATVAKHIRSLFDKLDLPPASTDHRRVLAVLTHLQRNEQG